jgi:Acyl dehydratase
MVKRVDNSLLVVKRGTVYYTSRDTILYAFGIGCSPGGDDDEKEIRYLYEHQVQFSVFPTFPLTLLFRVPVPTFDKHEQVVQEYNDDPSSLLYMFGMPRFPPPSMFHPSSSSRRRRDDFSTSTSNVPRKNASSPSPDMIHLGQKLWIQGKIPNGCTSPVKVDIESRLLSVRPYQQKGVITVTESKFYEACDKNKKRLFATSQMIVLFFLSTTGSAVTCDGFSSPSTFPYVQIPKRVLEELKLKQEKTFVKRYFISSNQALLYRLSGDTNRIHVEGTSGEFFPTKGPILHGLCTLGYATRAVLSTFANSDDDEECNYIDCRFTLPLSVGEDIEVRMWQVEESMMQGVLLMPEVGSTDTRLVAFQVISIKTGQVVVDGGMAGITRRKGDLSSQCGNGEKLTLQRNSKL